MLRTILRWDKKVTDSVFIRRGSWMDFSEFAQNSGTLSGDFLEILIIARIIFGSTEGSFSASSLSYQRRRRIVAPSPFGDKVGVFPDAIILVPQRNRRCTSPVHVRTALSIAVPQGRCAGANAPGQSVFASVILPI
jgi:hypothetical protein